MIGPVAYQGSKQRIAKQIVDMLSVHPDQDFYDICCGNGSVSIELVNRGHDPRKIVMIDAGPWGAVWEAVGNGTFNLDTFSRHIADIPHDPREIKGHMEALAAERVSKLSLPYVFLKLQAAAFGGKAIWIKDGRWQNCTFRAYWEPTATSSRRSPVNPMMPMPPTLFVRVAEIVERMRGMSGLWMDANNFMPCADGVVYIDPPYAGTTGYGHTCDPIELARKYTANCDCFVSEGRALGKSAVLVQMGRSKGGISGARKKANHEWLSYFQARKAVAA